MNVAELLKIAEKNLLLAAQNLAARTYEENIYAAGFADAMYQAGQSYHSSPRKPTAPGPATYPAPMPRIDEVPPTGRMWTWDVRNDKYGPRQ